jgi:hypothetical protein
MLGQAQGEKTSESERLNILWVCMDHLVMLAQPKKKVAPLSNILHTNTKQPMPIHIHNHCTSSYHHDYKQTNMALGYKWTNLTGPDDASRIIWALGMFFYIIDSFF